LKEFNIVSGENLSAHKARILLMLGLTVTEETEALQNYFDQM
jgi:L-asparaginase/Glu-tRNA(Gln) amidotransferase subunit D